MNKTQKVLNNQDNFTEDVVTYFLYREIHHRKSKVFFKIKHNISIVLSRNWYYCCGPDIDVLEIMDNEAIVGYEVKGMRKYKGIYEAQAWYEGLDEVLAYLVLPHIMENKKSLFDGGVFDHIYLVQGRQEKYIEPYEEKVFNLTPIGVIIATPDGKLTQIKEAPQNPLQSKGAKEHLLKNLDTLQKFSENGKEFKQIRKKGEEFLRKKKLLCQ